jgi:nicotinamide-nucleotide amidase
VKSLNALSVQVSWRLKHRRLQLATAESCTGGWVAQVVTAIPGSSAWFERGFVTYSNAAKQELLGVSKKTLKVHGAVSEETAREMACGALRHSRANVALAVTGVAGPSGGSVAKPVGMVCFAWCTSKIVFSRTLRFKGDREAVRRRSVIAALEGLLGLLDGG